MYGTHNEKMISERLKSGYFHTRIAWLLLWSLWSWQSPRLVENASLEKKLVGRVGSRQEVFEIWRVASGRVGRFTSITGRAGSPWPDPTLERWSDPLKKPWKFVQGAVFILRDIWVQNHDVLSGSQTHRRSFTKAVRQRKHESPASGHDALFRVSAI